MRPMPAFRVDFRIQPNGSGKGQEEGCLTRLMAPAMLDERSRSTGPRYAFDKNGDLDPPMRRRDAVRSCHSGTGGGSDAAEGSARGARPAPFYRRSAFRTLE